VCTGDSLYRGNSSIYPRAHVRRCPFLDALHILCGSSHSKCYFSGCRGGHYFSVCTQKTCKKSSLNIGPNHSSEKYSIPPVYNWALPKKSLIWIGECEKCKEKSHLLQLEIIKYSVVKIYCGERIIG
jgi:hypothetical protein